MDAGLASTELFQSSALTEQEQDEVGGGSGVVSSASAWPGSESEGEGREAEWGGRPPTWLLEGGVTYRKVGTWADWDTVGVDPPPHRSAELLRVLGAAAGVMTEGDAERSSPHRLPGRPLLPLGLGQGGGGPCCLLLQEALPDSPGLGHCLFGASVAFGAAVHIRESCPFLRTFPCSPLGSSLRRPTPSLWPRPEGPARCPTEKEQPRHGR